MAFLPDGPLELHGGCCCGMVEYVIQVPGLEARPLIPSTLPTPISAFKQSLDSHSATDTHIPTRLPVIDLDHCDTCRKAAGALIQCWFICPVEWVTWNVTPIKEISKPDDENQKLTLSTITAVGPAARSARDILHNTSISLYQATESATRSFCSRCGTSLAYVGHSGLDGDMPVVDVSVGSMDVESLRLVRPDRHGWYEDGIDWVKDMLTHGDKGLLMRHPEGIMSDTVTP